MPKRLLAEIRNKAASVSVHAARPFRPTPTASSARLRELVRMVTSHRVTSDDRLRLLGLVTTRLGHDLASDPPAITVHDASEEPFRSAAEAMWRASGLEVDYLHVQEPQLATFVAVASTATEPYLALQFDDTLTVGLSPTYLRAACQLLERWRGRVQLVCPMWALRTEIVTATRTVRVISYSKRGRAYQFKGSRPRRPLLIEHVDGLPFGIFENPGYGFFFNHMVVPRADYARRVQWYSSHIDNVSVHKIELAAAGGLVGPTWRHAAICLDDVSLLDLDYSHTAAAIRPNDIAVREVADRLSEGWSLEVVHG